MKLVYCYSGTTNLWYGNWNRHVCHKWKYEVDRPSRSTEVNPGKKQKCCSLLFLWSQVQWYSSGPCYSQTLGCLSTSIIEVVKSEIEPIYQLFPSVWKQRLYKFCFIWIEKYVGYKRAKLVTIGIPTICWKFFPAKATKMLSTRNSGILMMSSSE